MTPSLKPGRVTVFLVEAHRLVRDALREVLNKERGIEVVGEASNASEALQSARSLRPGVVVLDIGVPDLDALEAAGRFASAVDARVVALSVRVERHLIADMLGVGAVAYVTKSSAGAELIRAIRAAAAGQEYACPEMAEQLANAVRQGGDDGAHPRLSHREREVLRLVAQGVRSSGIADRLRISVGTVEVHRRNMMRKLGVRSIAELTLYAVREGLVAA
jgi:two-component system NarL family response regulator